MFVVGEFGGEFFVVECVVCVFVVVVLFYL